MKAVVVGSGAAGLFAAFNLRRRGFDVVLVTEELKGGSTYLAKGGIAVPVDEADVEAHLRDTIKAGDGLMEVKVAELYIGLARRVYSELLGLGFRPERLVLEGGHSKPRVASVGGDATGRALWEALIKAVEDVEIIERRAVGLLLDGGRAVGISLDDEDAVKADAVVAATGGYAGLYKYSTNSSAGDFLLALFEAGAFLRDLEFVQFHPTATKEGELVSESVRGAGARLINARDERFMPRYDPRGELATRDVVSRAVYREIEETGSVYLDVSSVDLSAFSGLRGLVEKYGTSIPVVPAAHYSIGGIAVDAYGRTNIKGLFVIGEASNSGFHGANRLASNSLLECLVQAELSAEAAEAYASSEVWDVEPPDCVVEEFAAPIRRGVEAARGPLWEYAGVIRRGDGLAKAVAELADVDTLAHLIARAALWRAKSRGVHYRADAPYRDDRFRARLCFRRP